ncbi:MAG: glucose-6-phosphate dehydrogenase [Planctomycetota bacterium]
MSQTLVIFGASGDLTSRKLIPALFELYRKKRLAPDTRIVGVARTKYTSDSWRDDLVKVMKKLTGKEVDATAWNEFAPLLHYLPLDIQQPSDFAQLGAALAEIEKGQKSNRVYYLSTLPRLYAQVAAQLGAAGLASEENGARRIVIEKPFGHDRTSARQLNDSLHEVFSERQIFRIDHYLGKETVQNLLVLRFANSIFEPIWNRNYIDHVQITVAEEVTVGRRGAYYDESGVLRDMFQNHLLQLMMVTAMESPARYDADLVRDEKVKVLRSVRSLQGATFAQDTFRGQYTGYRDEEGVPKESETATFAALKLHVDNWRWNGVPFYLRSGKAMSCRTTQIVIQFREPPHMLFADGPRRHMDANRLVMQIQPAEGIQLQFQTKIPDAGMRLQMTDLDFQFGREFSGSLPDAYQRLLLDALNGDASLFARSDEVELAWGIIDPILKAWQSPAAPELHFYPINAWGPDACVDWMRSQKREWFDFCPVLK